MFDPRQFMPTRRQFIAAGGAVVTCAVLPTGAARAAARDPIRLRPDRTTAHLIGPNDPETPVLAYNGSVPGPLLRARQGETMEVVLVNDLKEPTTLHWHGLRVPNGMDGVPYLTQAPVQPGESFTYTLPLKDAGTFWYHPHINSSEQIGRGLYGALIVDEIDPPKVDRDVLWVLDDWRLKKDGQIHESFGAPHDRFHNGRLGNVATVNGSGEGTFPVSSGERIRLRLVNAANARIFGLEFGKLRPWVIATDAHPVQPYRLDQTAVVIAPGQRVDLILDLTGKPNTSFDVIDTYFDRQRYALMTLQYGMTPVRGLAGAGTPASLADNPVAAPDLKNAERMEFAFDGGMHTQLREVMLGKEKLPFMDLMRRGMAWTINGRVHPPMTGSHTDEPLATLKLGKTYLFDLENRSDWDHPIHLHGLAFQILDDVGNPIADSSFRDTVLLTPGERRTIAFVADNPGDWMFHCHILEHQESGMMGFVRVAA